MNSSIRYSCPFISLIERVVRNRMYWVCTHFNPFSKLKTTTNAAKDAETTINYTEEYKTTLVTEKLEPNTICDETEKIKVGSSKR